MSRDTVTLRDIYDVVDRLEKKMTMRIDKVDERVNILEDFKSKAAVLGSIGMVILSGVFSFIWKYIER